MKKGIALIWALALSGILLIISATMVNYITKESRFSVQIEDSGSAYGAARSGIEWAIGHLNNGADPADLNGKTLNIGSATVSLTTTGSGPIVIGSKATVNNVNRKIEYTYDNLSPGTAVDFSTLGATTLPTNTESFTVNFYFWGNNGNGSQFGLDSAAGSGKLSAGFSAAGALTLNATDSAGAAVPGVTVANGGTSYNLNTDANKNKVYRYKGVLRYIKDTSAHLRILRREAGVETCMGTATMNLNGRNLGDLNSLYFYAPGGTTYYNNPAGAADGDGTWADLSDGGSNHIYVDNILFKGAALVHTVSVSYAGSGSGYATSNPTGIDGTNSSANFGAGSTVVLSANARSGSVFGGWSGGGCSGLGTCTINVTGAVNVTATFNTAPVYSYSYASSIIAQTGWLSSTNALGSTTNTYATADLTGAGDSATITARLSGTVYNTQRVQLYLGTNNTSTANYKIEVSSNGSTWYTVYSSNIPGITLPQYITETYTPSTVGYIRLTVTQVTATPHQIRLDTIRAYGE